MNRGSLPRDRIEHRGISPEQLERARQWAARFPRPSTNREAWDAFFREESRVGEAGS